jgi:DNA-binding response OmpR family regulator
MENVMAAKILVVDDEPDILFLVTYYLKTQGYQVTGVRSGAEALKTVETDVPDLMILDVLMPELTGLEVCEELRRRPETAGVRIILFSALAQGTDRIKGLTAGADDYVSKPINLQELAGRVKGVLQHSRTS